MSVTAQSVTNFDFNETNVDTHGWDEQMNSKLLESNEAICT